MKIEHDILHYFSVNFTTVSSFNNTNTANTRAAPSARLGKSRQRSCIRPNAFGRIRAAFVKHRAHVYVFSFIAALALQCFAHRLLTLWPFLRSAESTHSFCFENMGDKKILSIGLVCLDIINVVDKYPEEDSDSRWALKNLHHTLNDSA